MYNTLECSIIYASTLNFDTTGERLTGMDMWSALAGRSEQHVIKKLMEQRPGRPKMTWNKLTENDCHE